MADELDGFLQFLARYRAAKRGEWSRKQSIDEDFPDPSLFDRHMEEIVSWIKKGFVICSASGNSDAALLSCLLSDHAVINLSPGIAYKLNFASRERLAPEEIVPWNAVVAVEETVDLIRNGRLRLLVERCITGNMTSHAILAAGLNLDDFPSGRRPSWYIWDGVKIQINAPHWRQQIAGDEFHENLRGAKLITLADVEIPIFSGINAQQIVELLDDEPSVLNLRDAIDQP